MRRRTGRCPKCPDKMAGRKSATGSEVRKREVALDAMLEEVFGTTFLPGSEATATARIDPASEPISKVRQEGVQQVVDVLRPKADRNGDAEGDFRGVASSLFSANRLSSSQKNTFRVNNRRICSAARNRRVIVGPQDCDITTTRVDSIGRDHDQSPRRSALCE